MQSREDAGQRRGQDSRRDAFFDRLANTARCAGLSEEDGMAMALEAQRAAQKVIGDSR